MYIRTLFFLQIFAQGRLYKSLPYCHVKPLSTFSKQCVSGFQSPSILIFQIKVRENRILVLIRIVGFRELSFSLLSFLQNIYKGVINIESQVINERKSEDQVSNKNQTLILTMDVVFNELKIESLACKCYGSISA